MPDDKPFNLDDIDFGQTIRGHQKDDRVFDRFVLKKLLGRGGMGVVWLAQDERLGRDVALKFAPEAIRYDEIAVEELKEETRKGLDLAHPNIVKIYDFLLDEDYAAISMEFIDGENLGALRTRQPNKIFEPRQITTWTSQLLDALDYAHRGAKVIHRDLKPANLMLDRSGNLRVTDFGIARSISEAMDRATLGRASTGTLAYMSPQQASGKSPSITDDLYAVGSTLYELITGKPPFHSGNITQQLKDDPVTPPSQRRREFGIVNAEPIPVEWEQTILACLEKSPENRPPTALAIMERLGLAAPSRAATETPANMPATPGASFPQSATGHVATAYVRPGAGLTEIAAPGRALTAGKIQVGGAPANVSVTPTAPAPGMTTTMPPMTAAPRKGHPILWILLFMMFMGVIAVGAGVWWGWDHGLKEQYQKLLAMIQKTPPVTPEPPVKPDKPDPLLEPPVKPNKPDKPENKDPVVVIHEPPVKPNPPPTGNDKPDVPPVKPSVPPDGQETKPPVNLSPLQALLANAKPGDTVKIPNGTYEETLVLKDGVNVVAAESGQVVVQTDGKSGPALRVENCKEGSITGIVFQHSGTEMGGHDPWPVALIKSSSVKLEDCGFQRSLGNGLQISGAGSSMVTRCHVDHCPLAGILVERGATPTITGCKVNTSGTSGIEVRLTGSLAKLIGNVCNDNAQAGIAVRDDGSAIITGDTICNSNKEVGIIAVGPSTDITVDGAKCEGNFVGILITDSALAKIKKVNVLRSKDVGVMIKQPAPGSELVDSVVDRSALIGIYLFGDKDSGVTLRGNQTTNNATSGIVMKGSGFHPVVDTNTSNDNGNVGIHVSEECSGEIRNNTFRGNKNGGIARVNAAKDLKEENNITDTAP